MEVQPAPQRGAGVLAGSDGLRPPSTRKPPAQSTSATSQLVHFHGQFTMVLPVRIHNAAITHAGVHFRQRPITPARAALLPVVKLSTEAAIISTAVTAPQSSAKPAPSPNWRTNSR